MNCNRLISLAAGVGFLLISGSVAAQRTVHGIVSSSQQNVPLPHVSVTVPGSTVGTATLADGSFQLTVPNDAKTLDFSYVGYVSQSISLQTLANGGGYNVIMYPDSSNSLGDVVVIGYGAVRKQDVAGAVTTLTTKDFQKGTVVSFDQMIAGKAAGISITPSSGQPGAGSTIRIRGISSINGSQDPLVVVDGVPFGGYVNPNDIESVTILKDASAAAIYGSQASGGVILITTKKGQPGEVKLNFNTLVSMGTIRKYADVLSASQFTDFVMNSPYLLAKGADKLLGGANTNWQKEIYQTAITSNSNLSVSGSLGKVLPYRLSAGYLSQSGILKTDHMNRATGNLNLTPSFFTNHLKVELNLNGYLSKHRYAEWGAINSAVQYDPTQPVYDPNNTFGGYYQWMSNGTYNSNSQINPVSILQQTHNTGNDNRGFGRLRLDYSVHFLPELHIIANWGFDVQSYSGRYRADSASLNAYKSNKTLAYGTDNPSWNKTRNLIAEYTLNYNKTIPSIKSNINAMATYSYQDTKYSWNNYRSYDYKGDTIPGTIPPLYPNGYNQHTLISYLGRLIYTYNDKYVLTASIRRDGSSRLSPATRWVTFPSVSVAWDIAKENFLKNSNTVSTLKLRLSYGKTANQGGGFGDYSYYPSYSLSDPTNQYQLGNSFYNMYAPAAYNGALTWETTTSTDGGLDFGFLHNRISGSFDLYHKNTKKLLITAALPAGTNFTNQFIGNVGEMTSKGAELNLNFIPIQNTNSQWTVNFNASYNNSKITKLTTTNDPSFKGIQTGGIAGSPGSYIQMEQVGQEPNSFLVYKQVYDANGKPIEGAYVDLSGDGAINPIDDQYFYHSPFPKWVFGFSTQYTYKRWTISTVLRSNVGNYVYNNVASNQGWEGNMNINLYNANASTSILNTHFINKQDQSDYYVENASFLRMDNIGITYNIGKISHSNKTDLTISANVQNVFVVTKYKGVDPEIYSGIDNQVYTVPRVYSLGLNLNF